MGIRTFLVSLTLVFASSLIQVDLAQDVMSFDVENDIVGTI